MGIAEAFGVVQLLPHGPVRWGTPVPERRPGIYVVTTAYEIVYIGRTTQPLQRRVGQFYRHKHGRRSPHRGGQDVKLLSCPLWIYRAPTDDPVGVEHRMIETFKARMNKLPFANRNAGTKSRRRPAR